jgi:hypothetical protein
LTAASDVEIRSWKFALPSTATEVRGSNNSYSLSGREGTLLVGFKPITGTEFSIVSTGDSRLGKGALGPIPLHIVGNVSSLKLKKGDKITWSMTLELGGQEVL